MKALHSVFTIAVHPCTLTLVFLVHLLRKRSFGSSFSIWPCNVHFFQNGFLDKLVCGIASLTPPPSRGMVCDTL